MIRLCDSMDLEMIFQIINDAARAYKGIIPEDRYHVPYMTMDELVIEIEAGVTFWGYEENEMLNGIMGIQDKGDVSLIRHAYVRSILRNSGIGTRLLSHLTHLTDKPFLIGTWESAEWAIQFYLKNGFELVPQEKKISLLKKYWEIPERQIETSVVLCNNKWLEIG